MDIFLPIEAIIIGSLVLNVLLLVLVFAVLLRIFRLGKKSDDHLKSDRRSHKRISKKLDDEISKEVNKILAQVENRVERSITAQVNNFSKQGSESLKNLAKFTQIHQESMTHESQILIANSMKKLEEDIEAYRKSEFEKINKLIYSMITSAAKDVLGKTLNPSEHEKLVEKAFERAKQNNFFK